MVLLFNLIKVNFQKMYMPIYFKLPKYIDLLLVKLIFFAFFFFMIEFKDFNFIYFIISLINKFKQL